MRFVGATWRLLLYLPRRLPWAVAAASLQLLTLTGCPLLLLLLLRRCGRTSFHIQKKVCAACGYPSARMRTYNWGKKQIRRKNEGTGRMRYMKGLPRRFKNGFREGVRTPT